MGFAGEIGIGAMLADAAEFGVELLAIGVGVHFTRGGGEFFRGDDAALGGGELKRGPIGIGLGEFEKIKNVIAAFGRGQEEGSTLAISQGGAEGFDPGFGFDEGEFVNDEKIEAVAAERIGMEGAVELDDGAVCELDDFERLAGAFGA